MNATSLIAVGVVVVASTAAAIILGIAVAAFATWTVIVGVGVVYGRWEVNEDRAHTHRDTAHRENPTTGTDGRDD